ncbi:MAG: hypothetical protein Q8P34_21310 [Bacteroidota bacterium]|nr:hypothetical protein [Bacteroidota bacterium]
MNPFESTIESPLQFLFAYIKYEGESYLHKQFVSAKEIDFRYNPEGDVIYVQKILPRHQTKGEVLDEEKNICEYELTFVEFVQNEFECQYKISKRLIDDRSGLNGDDQDKKLYKQILVNCLEAQKYIDSLPDLNFITEINQFIRRTLSHVYRKFDIYHSKLPEIKLVKNYYLAKSNSNITGFRLKGEVRSTRQFRIFVDYLFRKQFVTTKTNTVSIEIFLKGGFPKSKIDWCKDLHELKFFIDEMLNAKILEKNPGQPWKYFDQIFTKNGVQLPINWQKNHNKLKDPSKRQAIIDLCSILVPRK